jgi:hypothetical protein
MCLAEREAVVAVVRPGPARLAAVASLALPPGWWQAPGADRAAAMADRRSRDAVRRVLVRMRRRLGLPRWCPLAVVAGPDLADTGGAAATVVVRSAELLARAGLVQGWVVAADRATALWSTVDVLVEPGLAAAAAGQPAELAVGAALAALPGEDPAAVPDGIELEEWRAGSGWAVQRIGDNGDIVLDDFDDFDNLIDLDGTADTDSGGNGEPAGPGAANRW